MECSLTFLLARAFSILPAIGGIKLNQLEYWLVEYRAWKGGARRGEIWLVVIWDAKFRGEKWMMDVLCLFLILSYPLGA